MSDIDPAAVMAAHAGHDSAGGCVLGPSTLPDHDHCEPYRLAGDVMFARGERDEWHGAAALLRRERDEARKALAAKQEGTR